MEYSQSSRMLSLRIKEAGLRDVAEHDRSVARIYHGGDLVDLAR